MKVHFIAIGGSIMHGLAISLKKKGYIVSGSDDKFFSPSKENLKAENLLPDEGWFPEKIENNLNFIILGMHAKIDNPELIEAQRKKIKIYSFPEYIAKESRNKKRIVIAGSHGKTTITSMIMHSLKDNNLKFDYVVGARISGFDSMVNLSKNKIIIIEGDEYLSSKLDKRPKFLHYMPDILILSGIAWDHINVFPTRKSYTNVFIKLLKTINSSCKIFYSNNDVELKKIVKFSSALSESYGLPSYSISNQKFHIKSDNFKYKLSVFGKHNLYNIEAARKVCNSLGLSNDSFFSSISSFSGAKNRLELLRFFNKTSNVYRDFAHSPSKVKASVEALKDLFPKRNLVACLELYTFSSLNLKFISYYKDVFKKSDDVWIFYSPKEIKRKGLSFISKKDILKEISHPNIKVIDTKVELINCINQNVWLNSNLLLMSSGDFQNINFMNLSIH